MCKDETSKDKKPGFCEEISAEEREISPPGYVKKKKFSRLMERALEAVERMGKKPVH